MDAIEGLIMCIVCCFNSVFRLFFTFSEGSYSIGTFPMSFRNMDIGHNPFYSHLLIRSFVGFGSFKIIGHMIFHNLKCKCFELLFVCKVYLPRFTAKLTNTNLQL